MGLRRVFETVFQGEDQKANARRSRRAFAVSAALQVSLAAIGASLPALTTPAAAQVLYADIAPRLKPPAPGPAYISRNDLARLNVLRDALKDRNYKTARSVAGTLEDPIATSLAQWYYFYAEDPRVDIPDATAYMNAHAEWPAQSRIQRHAENRIVSTTPASDILALFEQRDPLTGAGKVALGRAQFTSGDREAGAYHIRDAWANNSFTLPEERTLLANYAGVLRAEDHIGRVDRLLWGRQVTNARRVFKYLPGTERRKAEARAALLLQAGDAPRLYNALGDAERNDAGVLHAAIRYYRRSKQEVRAIQIARTAPTDPDYLRNPARIWEERQLLMRWALKNNLYADAYTMAASHGLEPGSTKFSEAEFNAGWIALRYLNKPKRAETHFAALTASVGTPISLSRGYYWLGRAAVAAGDAASAKQRFQQAARYPYAYYGQLAIEQLGGRLGEPGFGAIAFSPIPPASPEEKARFASRPSAQALRMLTEVDDGRAFLIFGYHLDDQLESAGEYLELADAAVRAQAPHVTVRAGKAGVRRGYFAPQVVYPTIYIPEEASRFVPPEVILGLSRQESEFNPRAYSPAGARGVMQLMPATAEITARKERVPYRRSALLNDPNYNMLIGSAHLFHLLADLNGYYPMVFAGYNAGKGRVRQWVDRYGDPRDPAIDPVDWIEHIPFSETRNYVQRVMENIQVYRSQLNGVPLAKGLAGALERGGPEGRVAGLPPLNSAGAVPDIAPRIVAIAAPVLDAPLADMPLSDAPITPSPMTPSQVQTHGDAGVGAVSPASKPASEPATNIAAAVKPGDSSAGAAATEPTRQSSTSTPPSSSPAPQSMETTPQTPIAADPKTPGSTNAPAQNKPSMTTGNRFSAAPASPLATPNRTTTPDESKEPAKDAQPLQMAPIGSEQSVNGAQGSAADALNALQSLSSATQTTTLGQAPASPIEDEPGAQSAPIEGSDQSPAQTSAALLNAAQTSRARDATEDGAVDGSDIKDGIGADDGACVTYTAFIAGADPDAVSAADLNAGAFAEWRSGGEVCD
ncbi:MAG: transglycosylase SLT domain-containing protein [Pseudomonadota bacterium]